MAKILSGCPVLGYLKLYHCGELNVLDLSQSPRLKTLEVIRNMRVRGPRQIVAPDIHFLRLYDPQLSCSLVDVSSLTEARLEISCLSLNSDFNANFLQVVVLKMLDQLKNAEKLKLGRNFIQVEFLDKYFKSKDGEHCVDDKLEHVASVVELMLKNCTEKLDRMVVLLDERYLTFKIEDLIATFSHNNNVLISSTNNPRRRNQWIENIESLAISSSHKLYHPAIHKVFPLHTWDDDSRSLFCSTGLTVAWVFFCTFLPETQGRNLEDMDELFSGFRWRDSKSKPKYNKSSSSTPEVEFRPNKQ
ncbi:putative F-box protein [Raphanus sativus]|nr:putative F-box protein [Raphanus sativus]